MLKYLGVLLRAVAEEEFCRLLVPRRLRDPGQVDKLTERGGVYRGVLLELAVGLDMYLRLLDEAIDELKVEHEAEEAQPPEVYLELQYSGYVPDSYVPAAMEKMELYKRIASVVGYEELEALEREVADRFGPLPEDVRSLFAIAEIRILCRRLFISSLKERDGRATVEFSKLSQISVDRVMTLIKESGASVSLDPKQPNCLIIKTGRIGLKEKSEFISERLSRLL